MKEFMDTWGSRKLLTLVLATVLLMMGKLGSLEWVTISGVYMAANVAEKFKQTK